MTVDLLVGKTLTVTGISFPLTPAHHYAARRNKNNTCQRNYEETYYTNSQDTNPHTISKALI